MKGVFNLGFSLVFVEVLWIEWVIIKCSLVFKEVIGRYNGIKN